MRAPARYCSSERSAQHRQRNAALLRDDLLDGRAIDRDGRGRGAGSLERAVQRGFGLGDEIVLLLRRAADAPRDRAGRRATPRARAGSRAAPRCRARRAGTALRCPRGRGECSRGSSACRRRPACSCRGSGSPAATASSRTRRADCRAPAARRSAADRRARRAPCGPTPARTRPDRAPSRMTFASPNGVAQPSMPMPIG